MIVTGNHRQLCISSGAARPIESTFLSGMASDRETAYEDGLKPTKIETFFGDEANTGEGRIPVPIAQTDAKAAENRGPR